MTILGKLVYGFNCGSGPVYIESPQQINDDRWHFAEFSRQAKSGKLYVDGNLVGESTAFGPAMNIEGKFIEFVFLTPRWR